MSASQCASSLPSAGRGRGRGRGIRRQPKEESRLKLDTTSPGGMTERTIKDIADVEKPTGTCTAAESVTSGVAKPEEVKEETVKMPETGTGMAAQEEGGSTKSKHRQVFEEAAASGREFVPQRFKSQAGADEATADLSLEHLSISETAGEDKASSLPPGAVYAKEFVPRSISSAGEGPGSVRPPDHDVGDAAASVLCDWSGSLGEDELAGVEYLQQVVNVLIVQPFALERELDNLLHTLNDCISTNNGVIEVAKVIFSAALGISTFAYVAARLIHLMEHQFRPNETTITIRTAFLKCCQDHFQNLETLAATPERREELQNFGMLVAEVYRNVTTNNKPIAVLSLPLLDIVDTLLLLNNDDTVSCACKILKLTGALLEGMPESKAKLQTTLQTLHELKSSSQLSRLPHLLINSVVVLAGDNWGLAPDEMIPESPIFIQCQGSSDDYDGTYMQGAGYEFSDAYNGTYAVDIDPDDLPDMATDESGQTPALLGNSSMQPVHDSSMWDEFVAVDDRASADAEDIDSEMEREYDRFLDEFDI